MIMKDHASRPSAPVSDVERFPNIFATVIDQGDGNAPDPLTPDERALWDASFGRKFQTALDHLSKITIMPD